MSVNLTDDHELQVQAYLRFAKLKRDQHVREVASTVKEFRSERLRPGDMYNFQELGDMFTDLESETAALVDREIQNAYHTNALLVKILLSQAQVNGLSLAVDTAQLENEFLLRQISASENTALSRPASDFVKRNTQLNKIGTVANISYQDPQLLKEVDSLRAEVTELKERLQRQQQETTAAMRERSTLNQQLLSLKDQLAERDGALRSAADTTSSTVDRLQQDLSQLSTEKAGLSQLSAQQVADLQRQVKDLTSELNNARQELDVHVNGLGTKEREVRAANDALNGKVLDTKQFQQMKAMMQQKSAEVVTLRKRLAKYEPQDVPNAD